MNRYKSEKSTIPFVPKRADGIVDLTVKGLTTQVVLYQSNG